MSCELLETNLVLMKQVLDFPALVVLMLEKKNL